jgi:uncharacterized protein YcfJ
MMNVRRTTVPWRAACAAAVLACSPLAAQAGEADDAWSWTRPPAEPRQQQPSLPSHCDERVSGKVVGGLLGALVGGKLGAEIAGDDDRRAGAVAGAALGALLGSRIGREFDRERGDECLLRSGGRQGA